MAQFEQQGIILIRPPRVGRGERHGRRQPGAKQRNSQTQPGNPRDHDVKPLRPAGRGQDTGTVAAASSAPPASGNSRYSSRSGPLIRASCSAVSATCTVRRVTSG